MNTWNNRAAMSQFVEVVLCNNSALYCNRTGRSFTGSSVQANVFSPSGEYDGLVAGVGSRSKNFACAKEAHAFACGVAAEYGLSFDEGNVHRGLVWSVNQ